MNLLRAALVVVAMLSARATAQPANDSCGAALPIAGFGITPYTTAAATTDGVDNPACNFFASVHIYNDVWYCWTATTTEPTQLRLCGSTFDTKLAVFDGCACPEGSGILACNDDSCLLESVLSFNALSGHSYLVRIGAYEATASGTGNLEARSALPGVLAGPFLNPANTHRYSILEASSWTLAEARAVAMGGHLATIRDASENEWVRATIANYNGTGHRLWIGLNDFAVEGSFVWTSGEVNTFTNWSSGEPNDSGGAEDAVELFGSNGLWNDNRDTPLSVIVYGCVELGACSADFNHDSVVNSQDLFDFLTAFFSSAPDADFNHDGTINSQDFFDFLAAFFTGC